MRGCQNNRNTAKVCSATNYSLQSENSIKSTALSVICNNYWYHAAKISAGSLYLYTFVFTAAPNELATDKKHQLCSFVEDDGTNQTLILFPTVWDATEEPADRWLSPCSSQLSMLVLFSVKDSRRLGFKRTPRTNFMPLKWSLIFRTKDTLSPRATTGNLVPCAYSAHVANCSVAIRSCRVVCAHRSGNLNQQRVIYCVFHITGFNKCWWARSLTDHMWVCSRAG